MSRRLWISLLCALGSRGAAAQDAALHGFVDCRLVDTPQQISWNEGGFGKARYGAGDQGFSCAAAALIGTWQVTPELLALADLQYQDSDHDALTLVEAYLRYRPVSTTAWRWSLKLGEFFPPISLENDAIGWTSRWTLTPSAINSWVGEELRTIGAEARLEWRGQGQTVEGNFAVFRSNDPAGELLAARGWSLSDLTSGLGSQVREPDGYALGSETNLPLRFNPFMENDRRVGWYAGLDWRAPAYGRLSLLRYDNRADPASHSNGVSPVFSWHTDFYSLGGETRLGDAVLIAQAMRGTTEIAPSPTFSTNTDFHAAYVLLGWDRGAWRPALRLDRFVTDQVPITINDRTRERGHAITAALNWRPRDWLRLTGELLRVDSTRSNRVEVGLPAREVDRQLQLSVRLLF
jgi:hypothetical protein